MANHKAGNVGDVFKHLILAEVLEEVRASGEPAAFWDVYAGMATYPLHDLRPEQTCGVLKFLESESLGPSVYRNLLNEFSGSETFPGSPAIALSLLPNSSFRFVDEDPESVDSILSFAKGRGIRQEFPLTYEGDALLYLRRFLDTASRHDETVALIDPFDPFGGDAGGRPIDEFMRCVERGIKTLLWYPVRDECQPGSMRDRLEQLVLDKRVAGGLSIAELVLTDSSEPRLTINPELYGCGFAFGNVEGVAVLERMRLDAAMGELYPGSSLICSDLAPALR